MTWKATSLVVALWLTVVTALFIALSYAIHGEVKW